MLKLHLKVCRKMLKRYYKCFSRRFPSYWMYRFLLASSLLSLSLSLSLFFFLGGGRAPGAPPSESVSGFGSASSPLFKNCVPFGSALHPLLGPLYALMREADPTLLLSPTSPAPCIFQIYCPASSLCISDQKHTHMQHSQAISWRTSRKS